MTPRSPLLVALALSAALALSPPGRQEEHGRPVILMIHGRGMGDRDTAALRKLWFDGLVSGAKGVTSQRLINEGDVRLVWYADVLDPRSTDRCEYAPGDPRARRDARTDPDVKAAVSLLGNVAGALASLAAGDSSTADLRSLAGDASFLSDSRARCASERRLAAAIDRASREGRPVILVAHSLGSIVAYDYLSSRRDTGVVQRLVSVGSPLGSAGLRHLLIGGDSTDSLAEPPSVRSWVNISNDGDPLAGPVSVARNVTTTAPSDEPDPHEMVGYLRNSVTAGAVLGGWCAAFSARAPAACRGVP